MVIVGTEFMSTGRYKIAKLTSSDFSYFFHTSDEHECDSWHSHSLGRSLAVKPIGASTQVLARSGKNDGASTQVIARSGKN